VEAEITLVLGGARSGKSEVAERRALALRTPVTYVATGGAPVDDPDWAERIERHRARRPADWTTVEVESGADLASVLRAIAGTVLIDSLGTWLAGLTDFGAAGTERRALCDHLVERRRVQHATFIVSEEVGLGVHPSTDVGRMFRDALGTLNRDIATVADSCLLVVAGRVLTLTAPEGS
jgi:adenosylcobinamide kinase / adenosylcobinamide-phosphate guanylyltransferase